VPATDDIQGHWSAFEDQEEQLKEWFSRFHNLEVCPNFCSYLITGVYSLLNIPGG
jgi:hypothetical protein